MCGRYTLSASLEDLQELLPGVDVSAAEGPRYNIAPTQNVAVVPNEDRPALRFFRWGLVPSWAKDESIGNKMINARSETLAEKPSFKQALRKRRCLVLADGFYEWRKGPGKAKTPVHVHREDRKPFAMAGLWERWRRADASWLESCTIITTAADAELAAIHSRTPVLLPAELRSRWISPEERSPAELSELLDAASATALCYHEVSSAVGNPRNQGPELIAPA